MKRIPDPHYQTYGASGGIVYHSVPLDYTPAIRKCTSFPLRQRASEKLLFVLEDIVSMQSLMQTAISGLGGPNLI